MSQCVVPIQLENALSRYAIVIYIMMILLKYSSLIRLN